MVNMKTWCNEVIGAENTRNLPYLDLSCLLFLPRVAGETRKPFSRGGHLQTSKFQGYKFMLITFHALMRHPQKKDSPAKKDKTSAADCFYKKMFG